MGIASEIIVNRKPPPIVGKPAAWAKALDYPPNWGHNAVNDRFARRNAA